MIKRYVSVDFSKRTGKLKPILCANTGPCFGKDLEHSFIDEYKEMGIKFVEEDPYLVNFRLKSLPMMEYGYKYVPCASVFNRCDYNTEEIMAYYKKYANDDQILGYITSPWVKTTKNERSLAYYEESFRFFKEAKEKIYG